MVVQATDPGKKSKKGKLTLEKVTYPASQEEMEAAAIFGKHDPAKVGTEQILTICEGKGDAAKDMLVEVFRCVLNCLPTHCLVSSTRAIAI